MTTSIQRKPDRRIARTRLLLTDALCDLIVERGYDQVTIQEIADRADVSRATFYLHFRDKEELLFASIDSLYADLENAMPLRTSLADLQRDGFTAELLDASDFIMAQRYAALFRALISKNGLPSFMYRIQQVYADALRILMKHIVPERALPVPEEVYLQYLSGAQVGLLAWWLQNDCPYPAHEMSVMGYQMFTQGVWQMIGLNVPTPDPDKMRRAAIAVNDAVTAAQSPS